MPGVGGEVVPEVLKVGTLAAPHQLFGRVAIEVEVPLVAQQPDLLPVAHAGQERVHQRDAFHFVRVLRGVGVGHHQADIVADDIDLAVAECLDQGVNVLRHGLLVVARLRNRRPARAAQVRRDDDALVAKPRHERQPHMAGFRVAVQQHDRRAAAAPGLQIVQVDAVGVDRVLLDCCGADRFCGMGERRERADQARHKQCGAGVPCHSVDEGHDFSPVTVPWQDERSWPTARANKGVSGIG